MAKARNTPKRTGRNTNQRVSKKEAFKRDKGSAPLPLEKIDINQDRKTKITSGGVVIKSPGIPSDFSKVIAQSARKALADHTKNNEIIAKIAGEIAKDATRRIEAVILDNLGLSPLQDHTWTLAQDWSIQEAPAITRVKDCTITGEGDTGEDKTGQEAKGNMAGQDRKCATSASANGQDPQDPQDLSRQDVVTLLKDLIAKAKLGDTTTGDAVRVADLVAKFGGMYGQLDTEVNVHLVQYKSPEYEVLKAGLDA